MTATFAVFLEALLAPRLAFLAARVGLGRGLSMQADRYTGL